MWQTVSGSVSVGLVLGKRADFDEPVLIWFEKMPQEGDSLNGIRGWYSHDVSTFSMMFPIL
jgi:hypothetical protein